MTALIARREALAARLASLTPRSLAAIKCHIELEWVTNDPLRIAAKENGADRSQRRSPQPHPPRKDRMT